MKELFISMALILGLVGCVEPEVHYSPCDTVMAEYLEGRGEPTHYYYEAPMGEGYVRHEWGWLVDCGMDYASFMETEGSGHCQVLLEPAVCWGEPYIHPQRPQYE